jgi:multidrug efflux pump subunit AcrB
LPSRPKGATAPACARCGIVASAVAARARREKVNIIGEQPERIFVSFSHDRLATLGVTTQDIFTALNSQNVLTPAGSIETRPQVFVRIDGAFDNLEKIRQTPIVVQGKTLKLSDVATVERGYEDPATFLVRNNGEPALLLGIVMRDDWNGLDLGKALEAEVSSINAGLPLGMTLSKVTDQAVNISSAVDEFMVKFFVALLVVMVVCFSAWAGVSVSSLRRPCR